MCVNEFIYKLTCLLRKESGLKTFGHRPENLTKILYFDFKARHDSSQG
jgi:hypothetical protein